MSELENNMNKLSVKWNQKKNFFSNVLEPALIQIHELFKSKYDLSLSTHVNKEYFNEASILLDKYKLVNRNTENEIPIRSFVYKISVDYDKEFKEKINAVIQSMYKDVEDSITQTLNSQNVDGYSILKAFDEITIDDIKNNFIDMFHDYQIARS